MDVMNLHVCTCIFLCVLMAHTIHETNPQHIT